MRGVGAVRVLKGLGVGVQQLLTQPLAQPRPPPWGPQPASPEHMHGCMSIGESF